MTIITTILRRATERNGIPKIEVASRTELHTTPQCIKGVGSIMTTLTRSAHVEGRVLALIEEWSNVRRITRVAGLGLTITKTSVKALTTRKRPGYGS